MLKGLMAWPLMGLFVAPSAFAQTTIQWVASGSGNWNNPANWSPGIVPQNNGHNAILGGLTPYTVTRSGLSFSLNNLHITNPSATLVMSDGGTMPVTGPEFINQGVVRLDGSANKVVTVRGGNTTTISGSGTIRLEAPSDSMLNFATLTTSNQSQLLTFGPLHTVAGTGSITARFRNEGAINADVAGRTLMISNVDAVNAGQIIATGGGVVHLASGFDQEGMARVLADGGVARFSSGTIVGGGIESSGGGQVRVENVTQFDSVRFAADVQVVANAALRVGAGGISNDGRIVVGSKATSGQASMDFLNVVTTIDGAGTIVLNSADSHPMISRINSLGTLNVMTTIGTEQTIAGTGLLAGKFINRGRLSPGDGEGSIGTLYVNLSGTLELKDPGVVELELLGTAPGMSDRIVNADNSITPILKLGGTLRVVTAGGFEAGPGNDFELIRSAYTGQFENVEFPQDGHTWVLEYGAGYVRAYVACSSDFDGSGFVDIDDYVGFVAAFEAGEDAADFDGTGFVDVDDFVAFVNAFEAGC